MIAPRWRKSLSDVGLRPGRSALAVLAMAIGICALTTLAVKQAILSPTLSGMKGSTTPASATFYTDVLDDSLVQLVRNVPGVGDVEARPMIMARLRVGVVGDDVWLPALLYVVPDFDDQRMSTFEPNDGAWPPARDEVLLERSAVSVAEARLEDELTLRIPGGAEQTLRFTGTVHAAGLAPAWMEHAVYGFIPWDSRVRDGAHRESAQLLMRVAEFDLEEGHIHEVADRVQATMEARGYAVRRVDIPTPGRHPHAGQMNTFMYLLAAFAILAFLLSSVLVASMIHTLQSEQVRQVGVMKAIGATRGQVAGVYLVHVGVLSLAALGVGVPAGWFAGIAYARFSAGILNAELLGFPFPILTLAGVAVVGVLVPVLAALTPVWRASRITVREALSDEPGAITFGGGRFDQLMARFAWLPRPMMLVLRAGLARRGRLALTVGMLAVGGGMFMSALNVSAAWQRAATEAFERRNYDLMVQFAERQPITELDRAFATVPAVDHVEYWPGRSVYMVNEAGAAGKAVTLLGVDPSSTLLEPRMTAGAWLDGADPSGVIINHGVQALRPLLQVGDSIAVRIDGQTRTFPIRGIVRELLPQPVVYLGAATLLAAIGESGETASTARVVTGTSGPEAQRAAARDLEVLFESRSIEVAALYRMDDVKGAVLDHLVIIQTILTLAAGIVVLVAGIGLTSTLTVSVVQRTREIGVMSAIGATPRTLAGHVWVEAVGMGLASWLLAIVLAAPISYGLEWVTGRMFFKAPLDFTVSGAGIGIWLLLVVVIASVSSAYPAFRAARLTVREAIAHV